MISLELSPPKVSWELSRTLASNLASCLVSSLYSLFEVETQVLFLQNVQSMQRNRHLLPCEYHLALQ